MIRNLNRLKKISIVVVVSFFATTFCTVVQAAQVVFDKDQQQEYTPVTLELVKALTQVEPIEHLDSDAVVACYKKLQSGAFMLPTALVTTALEDLIEHTRKHPDVLQTKILTNILNPINPATTIADSNYTVTLDGSLRITGSTTVCQALFVDAVRSKSGGAVDLGAVDVAGDLCIDAGFELATNSISAKTTGTVTINDNVCIAEGKTLSVDRIRRKSLGAVGLDLGVVIATHVDCTGAVMPEPHQPEQLPACCSRFL